MPRRYARYLEEFTELHQWSTYGAFLLGVGLFVALGVVIHSLMRGRKAPPNPWGGATLEWQCASPPPYFNFENPPRVNEPYDYTPLKYIDEEHGWEYVHPSSPEVPDSSPEPAKH